MLYLINIYDLLIIIIILCISPFIIISVVASSQGKGQSGHGFFRGPIIILLFLLLNYLSVLWYQNDVFFRGTFLTQ